MTSSSAPVAESTGMFFIRGAVRHREGSPELSHQEMVGIIKENDALRAAHPAPAEQTDEMISDLQTASRILRHTALALSNRQRVILNEKEDETVISALSLADHLKREYIDKLPASTLMSRAELIQELNRYTELYIKAEAALSAPKTPQAPEREGEPGRHGFDSENCPTFYDGCNCPLDTPAGLVHRPLPILLPCPFCGQNGYLFFVGDHAKAKCLNSECDGEIRGYSLTQAAKRWNRRAAAALSEPTQEQVKAIAASHTGWLEDYTSTDEIIMDCVKAINEALAVRRRG